MLARVSTLAVLTGVTLTIPTPGGAHFTLGSTGAVRLTAEGRDARYGVIGKEVNGFPMLSLSLGANNPGGSILLSQWGDSEPQIGRYPILADPVPEDGRAFHASFVAGPPEQPLGWFQGQSGWVRITEVGAGRMAGEFEIRARGFTREHPEDERQWVTVRGKFEARAEEVGVAMR